MPLPNPILDDRSYQQLRDELVRRIPVYAPEWTDHNATDPGITLIELFAFLGENLLFRFNQIPDATRLEFLRMLDLPLRPATAARALVAFGTKATAGVPVDQGEAVKARDLSFELADEVRVWPVSAIGASKRVVADTDLDPDARDDVERALATRGGLDEGEEVVRYETALVPAEPEAPGATPVDFAQSVDGVLWIAVLAEDGAEIDALRGGLLNVGFAPDAVVASMDDVEACRTHEAAPPPPKVVWQVGSGRLRDGEPIYTTLQLEKDTTSGLRERGVVRLRLPEAPDALGDFPLADPDAAGVGDLPPLLADEELAGRVLFWLRAYRVDGSRVGRVAWMGANASMAVQRRRARPELLGAGNGQPDQRFRLVHSPVIAGSLVLEVEEVDGWTRWTEVDDFHASGPDDRHFVLDWEGGEVRFGTGEQARLPQIAERIRATSYLWGGGPDGNVAAGAIDKLERPPTERVTVENPLRGSGGFAGETLAEALRRIPGELRRRDRAVTAGDFRELAMLPGVGRAETLPLFHPRHRELEAAGVVSVMIWPTEDRRNPDAPMPDRQLVEAVCARLDRRRLVTTELYVIPPSYRPLTLAVGLKTKNGYGTEAVHRWVDLIVRQYLAPLPPYGPEGEGWPLGRRVYGPEVEAAVLQVEGVEYVEGVRLAEWDEAGERWREVPAVELERWEVPRIVGDLGMAEGQPPAPGAPIGPDPGDAVPVHVPVIREEC